MKTRLLTLLFFIHGSSLYSQNLDLVTTLEQGIIESSGLILVNGHLITHNDSGGENALFEIDTNSGDINRTVYVSNAINSDWEDICNDDDFIYLADFGNNAGNRTSLAIYKISIDDYLNTPNDSVLADTISFSYSDQTDFTSGSNNTNFDSEAIISYGNALYIFSKNWLDSRCNIYELSKNPGTYSIAKVDSFDSDGLITGACYNELSNSILLTGYGPPIPFVVRFEDVNTLPFSTNYRIHNFVQVPSGTSVQIEAVCPISSDTYYISSEQSQLGDAMLSILDVNSLLPIREIPIETREVFPNPSQGFINVKLYPEEYMVIYNIEGTIIKKTNASIIDTKILASGLYFGIIYSKSHIEVAHTKFIIN